LQELGAVNRVMVVTKARENVALFGRASLPADVRQAVGAAVPELPETVITPFLWKVAK